MAQRLLKLYLPGGESQQVSDVLEENELLGIWLDRLEDDVLEVTLLTKDGSSESVLDKIERRFSSTDGYRLVLLPVAASLPRANEDEDEEDSGEAEESEEKRAARISREELYHEALRGTELTRVYLVLVLLSSVVAASGMIRDNPAVIIGAMVIAPLLGPNVALSLATTLGDLALARRAVRIAVVGFLVALAFSAAVGFMFDNLLASAEIAARTRVDLSDIGIALAAGVAGALSFTTGVPAALIGVMVAVALLPPLVSFGMLLGAGLWSPATGAMLLFLTNIICVNLAGVGTFLAQGIKPASWYEARTARKAALASISLWLSLLLLLVGVIILADPATRFSLTLPD